MKCLKQIVVAWQQGKHVVIEVVNDVDNNAVDGDDEHDDANDEQGNDNVEYHSGDDNDKRGNDNVEYHSGDDNDERGNDNVEYHNGADNDKRGNDNVEYHSGADNDERGGDNDDKHGDEKDGHGDKNMYHGAEYASSFYNNNNSHSFVQSEVRTPAGQYRKTVTSSNKSKTVDTSHIVLPPKIKKHGRPKGAGLTVIGLPRKKKCIAPKRFLMKSPEEKESHILQWILSDDLAQHALDGHLIDINEVPDDPSQLSLNLLDENVNWKFTQKYFTKGAWNKVTDLITHL